MSGERTFIGPLTEKQQLFIDEAAARNELKQFIPERCSGCWPHLEVTVLGSIATRVAKSEITLTDSTKNLLDYVADCSGAETDTTRSDAPVICPKEIEEKKRGRTDCW